MSPEDGAAKAGARNHRQIWCPRGPTSLSLDTKALGPPILTSKLQEPLPANQPSCPHGGARAGAAGLGASQLEWEQGGNLSQHLQQLQHLLFHHVQRPWRISAGSKVGTERSHQDPLSP